MKLHEYKFITILIGFFCIYTHCAGFGNIDDLSIGDNKTFQAHGWAYSGVDNDKILSISFYIDDSLIARGSITPADRPDVVRVLGTDAALRSGWSYHAVVSNPIDHKTSALKAVVLFEKGGRVELVYDKHLSGKKTATSLNKFMQAMALVVSFCIGLALFAFVMWRIKLLIRSNRMTTRAFLCASLIMAAFLWVVRNGPLFAVGDSPHDCQLFISLANNIGNGNWLGGYTQFTLMKGCMYPLWLAFVNILGLPLLFAQHVLYAAVCVFLLMLVIEHVKSAWVVVLMLAILLFNPAVAETSSISQVLRSGISPALTLGIVAGFIGLYNTRSGSKIQMTTWALLGGVSLAAFWLNREEGIWMLPFVIPVWCHLLYLVWKQEKTIKTFRILAVFTPGIVFAACLWTVCGINYAYYGIFTTCEFKHSTFKDAYGALVRVEPQVRKRFVPVSKESREMIYKESPAFAELRPFLDGPLGAGWSSFRSAGSTEQPGNLEIEGGWFMWLLRDAVREAGHAKTGADAMRYYRTLADEINTACDQGRLPARGNRSGFVPVFSSRDISAATGMFFKNWASFVAYKHAHFNYEKSFGAHDSLVLFSSITHEQIFTDSGGFEITPSTKVSYMKKLTVWRYILIIYRYLIPVVMIVSLLRYIYLIYASIRRRSWSFWMTVSGGILASVTAMVGMLSLISVAAWGAEAINVSYLAPCYPLLLLFAFTVWLPAGGQGQSDIELIESKQAI